VAKAKKATTKKATKKTIEVLETPPVVETPVVPSRTKEQIQGEIDVLQNKLSGEVSQVAIRELTSDIAALQDEIGNL